MARLSSLEKAINAEIAAANEAIEVCRSEIESWNDRLDQAITKVHNLEGIKATAERVDVDEKETPQ